MQIQKYNQDQSESAKLCTTKIETIKIQKVHKIIQFKIKENDLAF